MRTLNKAYAGWRVPPLRYRKHVADPWPGGVDQNPRVYGLRLSAVAAVKRRQMPDIADTLRSDRLGAGPHNRAAIGRIARIKDDKAGIIDPAIRILEAERITSGLERSARNVLCQIESRCRRQQFASAEVVIQEKSKAKEPRRPKAFMIGQDKTQRPDDVRRDPPQHFALSQRFMHQAEFQVFEVAQAAVNKLRGG